MEVAMPVQLVRSRRIDASERRSDRERAIGARAEQLNEIDLHICRLFALVVDGLGAATSAFLAGDRTAAQQVTIAEVLIDQLHDGTEELLERQLRTLLDGIDPDGLVRLVLALRILPELERSGDLVEHIAARASLSVVSRLPADVRALIGAMSEVAVELWRRAASTFGGVDVWSPEEFRSLDDELDDLHVQLCDRLAEIRLPVAVAIDMGLIARFYERLGDHAVNVARRVDDDACRVMDGDRT